MFICYFKISALSRRRYASPTALHAAFSGHLTCRNIARLLLGKKKLGLSLPLQSAILFKATIRAVLAFRFDKEPPASGIRFSQDVPAAHGGTRRLLLAVNGPNGASLLLPLRRPACRWVARLYSASRRHRPHVGSPTFPSAFFPFVFLQVRGRQACCCSSGRCPLYGLVVSELGGTGATAHKQPFLKLPTLPGVACQKQPTERGSCRSGPV